MHTLGCRVNRFRGLGCILHLLTACSKNGSIFILTNQNKYVLHEYLNISIQLPFSEALTVTGMK